MRENPYRAEPLERLTAEERDKSPRRPRRLLSALLLFCGSCAAGITVATLDTGLYSPVVYLSVMLFATAVLITGFWIRR